MVEEPAKPVDNGQTKPQAAVTVSFCRRELEELAKDTLLVIVRNAGTGVPDFDTQHLAAPATSDDDPAMQCIAHGVGYQIEHDPFEQQGVAAHPRITSHDAQAQAFFSRGL